jgi:CRP-like cAMP-binding protein
MSELLLVSLLGLATTSSSMLGVVIGLYAPLSRKLLAGILAFAAGALISALAIELAFKGALELHHLGFRSRSAWAFVAGGFAAGAVIYYIASFVIEKKGGAVRTPARFREFVLNRKMEKAKERIALLSNCDLMRHLPADAIEAILSRVRVRCFGPGSIVFRAGDPGDALYIVARGTVQVVENAPVAATGSAGSPVAALGSLIAELGPGVAFGEMALLTGGTRTATVLSPGEAELLELGKEEFKELVVSDPAMARAIQRLSHERAISNLRSGGPNPSTWARVASDSMDHLDHREAERVLKETGQGAGLAIVLGNILDTIPGCLVIGATFNGLANISLTLMLGMFIGGIPEAAASAAMLKKAGYRRRNIAALWSTVLAAGIVAAAAGRILIGSSESRISVFCEAIAGGAVLALVAHAMIPEAIHEGGSRIVLPTVAGFLFALYFALITAFV